MSHQTTMAAPEQPPPPIPTGPVKPDTEFVRRHNFCWVGWAGVLVHLSLPSPPVRSGSGPACRTGRPQDRVAATSGTCRPADEVHLGGGGGVGCVCIACPKTTRRDDDDVQSDDDVGRRRPAGQLLGSNLPLPTTPPPPPNKPHTIPVCVCVCPGRLLRAYRVNAAIRLARACTLPPPHPRDLCARPANPTTTTTIWPTPFPLVAVVALHRRMRAY